MKSRDLWKTALLGSQHLLGFPVSPYMVVEQLQGHGLVDIGVLIQKSRDDSEGEARPRSSSTTWERICGKSRNCFATRISAPRCANPRRLRGEPEDGGGAESGFGVKTAEDPRAENSAVPRRPPISEKYPPQAEQLAQHGQIF